MHAVYMHAKGNDTSRHNYYNGQNRNMMNCNNNREYEENEKKSNTE